MFFVGLLAYTDMLPVRQPPKTFFIKSSSIDIQKHSFSRVGAKVWTEIPDKNAAKK